MLQVILVCVLYMTKSRGFTDEKVRSLHFRSTTLSAVLRSQASMQYKNQEVHATPFHADEALTEGGYVS